jgi:NTP pyrophosphatase (non-canonical NTP hydrolase)
MQSPHEPSLNDITHLIRNFVAERGWQHFHDIKNLSMAIGTEAAELMALFRWMRSEDCHINRIDPAVVAEARKEVADVLILAIEFADVAGFNVAEAVMDKLRDNAIKYPIEKAYGSNQKYDRL